MKVSIIIPVLDSHEVVRRQLMYFNKMELPNDVEVIIVDDGSDPPLQSESDGYITNTERIPNLTIHRTFDERPWTWAFARNAGARLAKGEYLLMYDVDHIATKTLIDAVIGFGGQKMEFVREFAVIDALGNFTQDRDVLKRYGLLDRWLKSLKVPGHREMFAMRKDVYWEIGGYREDVYRPDQREQSQGRLIYKAWKARQAAGNGQVDSCRPTIYIFPNGKFCGEVDYNPFGLFHCLSRKPNG